jgi:hypothetical protein
MTPVELKLTLQDKAEALVEVGQPAVVGEFVRQPGQFAFGEFRDPALGEYYPRLAATVRTAARTWKKHPSQWPWHRITFIAKHCP